MRVIYHQAPRQNLNAEAVELLGEKSKYHDDLDRC